jgi:hypothetical protein
VLFRTSVVLIAAGSVFTGCGGSDGSRNEGSFPDSGQYRDALVASDIGDASAGQGLADVANQGDADGASCAPGSGTFVVSVGNATGAACECNWSATGRTDASAANGSMNTLDGFSVACVPAGNYDMQCSCGPTGITGPPDADEGYCTAGAQFSVTPGATANVAVDVGCPE